jgi:NADH:ubiquinone oxidoreductase subunit H
MAETSVRRELCTAGAKIRHTSPLRRDPGRGVQRRKIAPVLPADRREPAAHVENRAAPRQAVHPARLDVGLLFAFAISSLSVYGATIAGWASHNKWSMMGGLRASSQMMSYEVTMGMAILVMFLLYGTLEPGAMAAKQAGSITNWGIFGVPQFISFILFLTAAIAETKRTPFVIPEGEPEIIGYFVEYSGLRFGMFFLGEFLEIVFTLCWWISDEVDVTQWMTITTALTFAYFISRGIAKASRVLEQ